MCVCVCVFHNSFIIVTCFNHLTQLAPAGSQEDSRVFD